MPKNQSRKRSRDAMLLAQWDARDDDQFDQLGISRELIKASQLELQGHIVMPGDETYDHDRMLSNPVFNPLPPLIVFCTAVPDVAIALKLAAEAPMPFTVRSGGHCTAGFSGGTGVLIDCKGLNSIVVDGPNKMATVGAGCTFSALNATLEMYGLHVPGGECEDVCVAGFVQGGGLGFTSVTYGMGSDRVLAMQVMLHDGSIVYASSTKNMDLWWAMRGGTGGNFGILLSVTFSLERLNEVTGWALAWPLSSSADVATATDVLMLLQSKYMRKSIYEPKLNLQVLLVYQTIIDPAKPPLPEPVPVFMVRGMWVGDAAEGMAAMQPLKQISGCVEQWSGTDKYSKVVRALIDFPQPQPMTAHTPYEDKACRYVARDLTPAEWTSFLTYYLCTPNTLSYIYLEFYGGAINSYPRGQSAFIHRSSVFNAVLDVYWYLADERPAAEQFLNGWIKLMDTVGNGEIYQNYCSLNVKDYAKAYWAEAAGWLYVIKQKYDPLHVFRFAQEVARQKTGASAPQDDESLPPDLKAAFAQPIDYTGGVKAIAKPAAN